MDSNIGEYLVSVIDSIDHYIQAPTHTKYRTLCNDFNKLYKALCFSFTSPYTHSDAVLRMSHWASSSLPSNRETNPKDILTQIKELWALGEDHLFIKLFPFIPEVIELVDLLRLDKLPASQMLDEINRRLKAIWHDETVIKPLVDMARLARDISELSSVGHTFSIREFKVRLFKMLSHINKTVIPYDIRDKMPYVHVNWGNLELIGHHALQEEYAQLYELVQGIQTDSGLLADYFDKLVCYEHTRYRSMTSENQSPPEFSNIRLGTFDAIADQIHIGIGFSCIRDYLSILSDASADTKTTRLATLRSISAIGEVLKRIPQRFKKQIKDFSLLEKLRNLVVHPKNVIARNQLESMSNDPRNQLLSRVRSELVSLDETIRSILEAKDEPSILQALHEHSKRQANQSIIELYNQLANPRFTYAEIESLKRTFPNDNVKFLHEVRYSIKLIIDKVVSYPGYEVFTQLTQRPEFATTKNSRKAMHKILVSSDVITDAMRNKFLGQCPATFDMSASKQRLVNAISMIGKLPKESVLRNDVQTVFADAKTRQQWEGVLDRIYKKQRRHKQESASTHNRGVSKFEMIVKQIDGLLSCIREAENLLVNHNVRFLPDEKYVSFFSNKLCVLACEQVFIRFEFHATKLLGSLNELKDYRDPFAWSIFKPDFISEVRSQLNYYLGHRNRIAHLHASFNSPMSTDILENIQLYNTLQSIIKGVVYQNAIVSTIDSVNHTSRIEKKPYHEKSFQQKLIECRRMAQHKHKQLQYLGNHTLPSLSTNQLSEQVTRNVL